MSPHFTFAVASMRFIYHTHLLEELHSILFHLMNSMFTIDSYSTIPMKNAASARNNKYYCYALNFRESIFHLPFLSNEACWWEHKNVKWNHVFLPVGSVEQTEETYKHAKMELAIMHMPNRVRPSSMFFV